eukprot:gnl/Dysnectes_brevis/2649_a3206_755.p1 GENE.gnl/Dysnectes_brevis/2649_a3206_755~~gnl/Dysnectes_brevis/2649_a3206_755.p1  ORF type:complete len:1372 (-),score=338.89 gnl/Dysnectes_brevis/2649_a3206_755:39-4154(-)
MIAAIDNVASSQTQAREQFRTSINTDLDLVRTNFADRIRGTTTALSQQMRTSLNARREAEAATGQRFEALEEETARLQANAVGLSHRQTAAQNCLVKLGDSLMGRCATLVSGKVAILDQKINTEIDGVRSQIAEVASAGNTANVQLVNKTDALRTSILKTREIAAAQSSDILTLVSSNRDQVDMNIKSELELVRSEIEAGDRQLSDRIVDEAAIAKNARVEITSSTTLSVSDIITSIAELETRLASSISELGSHTDAQNDTQTLSLRSFSDETRASIAAVSASQEARSQTLESKVDQLGEKLEADISRSIADRSSALNDAATAREAITASVERSNARIDAVDASAKELVSNSISIASAAVTGVAAEVAKLETKISEVETRITEVDTSLKNDITVLGTTVSEERAVESERFASKLVDSTAAVRSEIQTSVAEILVRINDQDTKHTDAEAGIAASISESESRILGDTSSKLSEVDASISAVKDAQKSRELAVDASLEEITRLSSKHATELEQSNAHSVARFAAVNEAIAGTDSRVTELGSQLRSSITETTGALNVAIAAARSAAVADVDRVQSNSASAREQIQTELVLKIEALRSESLKHQQDSSSKIECVSTEMRANAVRSEKACREIEERARSSEAGLRALIEKTVQSSDSKISVLKSSHIDPIRSEIVQITDRSAQFVTGQQVTESIDEIKTLVDQKTAFKSDIDSRISELSKSIQRNGDSSAAANESATAARASILTVSNEVRMLEGRVNETRHQSEQFCTGAISSSIAEVSDRIQLIQSESDRKHESADGVLETKIAHLNTTVSALVEEAKHSESAARDKIGTRIEEVVADIKRDISAMQRDVSGEIAALESKFDQSALETGVEQDTTSKRIDLIDEQTVSIVSRIASLDDLVSLKVSELSRDIEQSENRGRTLVSQNNGELVSKMERHGAKTEASVAAISSRVTEMEAARDKLLADHDTSIQTFVRTIQSSVLEELDSLRTRMSHNDASQTTRHEELANTTGTQISALKTSISELSGGLNAQISGLSDTHRTTTERLIADVSKAVETSETVDQTLSSRLLSLERSLTDTTQHLSSSVTEARTSFKFEADALKSELSQSLSAKQARLDDHVRRLADTVSALGSELDTRIKNLGRKAASEIHDLALGSKKTGTELAGRLAGVLELVGMERRARQELSAQLNASSREEAAKASAGRAESSQRLESVEKAFSEQLGAQLGLLYGRLESVQTDLQRVAGRVSEAETSSAAGLKEACGARERDINAMHADVAELSRRVSTNEADLSAVSTLLQSARTKQSHDITEMGSRIESLGDQLSLERVSRARMNDQLKTTERSLVTRVDGLEGKVSESQSAIRLRGREIAASGQKARRR